MSTLEITVNVLMTVGFILLGVQFLIICRPFTRKLYSLSSDFLVKKFMQLPKYKKNEFNFHYSSLNRFQIQKIYGEILKDDTRAVLTIFEFLKIMRYVTKTAESYGIEPKVLFNTVEHIDGRGELKIPEIADLLSQGISVKEITDKTRKSYSFEQIIETKGIPVEWTDSIYDKGFNSHSSPFYGF